MLELTVYRGDLNSFMDSVIDKETLGVSKEEFLVIFESLSSNPSRRHLAIKFLRTRLPAVIRYLNGTRSINVLFSLLTDYLHTEEELLEVLLMNFSYALFACELVL